MSDISITPILGMDTVSEDVRLVREQGAFVRDAVNFDITPSGRAELRPGARLVSTQGFRSIWQAPSGCVYGVLGDQWGLIERDWSFSAKKLVGDADVFHEFIDGRVMVSANGREIFSFDGGETVSLEVPQPPPPMLSLGGNGSMPSGLYGARISWVRGSTESASSALSYVELADAGRLDLVFPMILDSRITGVRLYLSGPDGGESRFVEEFPAGTSGLSLSRLPTLGRPAPFVGLSSMPAGRFLKAWRGRLLVAVGSVLRFSEAMAFHLHDELHGFIQFPQRITFIQPVEGGIWVGQVDHVAFLAGDSPSNLTLQRKASRAPIPGSSIRVSNELIGDVGQGGAESALWLAENGYVIGTASGQIAETQAGRLTGIQGDGSPPVVLGRRVYAAVG